MNDLDFYNLLSLEKEATVLGAPGPRGSGEYSSQVKSPGSMEGPSLAPGAGSSTQLPSPNLGSKQDMHSMDNRVRVNAPTPTKLAEEQAAAEPPKPLPPKPLTKEQIAFISGLGGVTGTGISNLIFPHAAQKAMSLSLGKRALLAGGMGLGGLGIGLLGVHMLGKFRKGQEEARAAHGTRGSDE